jgi:hypothetical protein
MTSPSKPHASSSEASLTGSSLMTCWMPCVSSTSDALSTRAIVLDKRTPHRREHNCYECYVMEGFRTCGVDSISLLTHRRFHVTAWSALLSPVAAATGEKKVHSPAFSIGHRPASVSVWMRQVQPAQCGRQQNELGDEQERPSRPAGFAPALPPPLLLPSRCCCCLPPLCLTPAGLVPAVCLFCCLA